MGTVESSADIVVRKQQLKPMFLRGLQSMNIIVGDTLVLEVEVGGFPVPEVTWYLNEKQISPTADKQIRKEGPFNMLAIPLTKVKLN